MESSQFIESPAVAMAPGFIPKHARPRCQKEA